MFLKRKVKVNEELMVVGSDVKTFITPHYYVIEFFSELKLKFKFYIGRWAYPQKDLAYYENKLFHSLVKFPPNVMGKFESAIINSYDEGLLHLTFNVVNRSLPRYFNIRGFIELESKKEVRVRYDELRNAFVFYNDDYVLVLGLKNIDSEDINKELIKTDHGYKINVFSRPYVKKEYHLDIVISRDIDTYDAYNLEHKDLPIDKRVEMSDKKVEKVYNLFYTYLKNHEFKDILLKLYVNYLLNPRSIKLPSKSPPSDFKYSSLLWRDLKNGSAPWILFLEENYRGNTLLHTLTLCNELLDKGEKEEAWRLLQHYSDALIDYFLYKQYALESVNLLYEKLLFVRAFHKLFLDSKSNYFSFYMPHDLMFLKINDYEFFKYVELINLHDNKYELSWKAYAPFSPKYKDFIIILEDKYGMIKLKVPFKWIKKENYYISKGKQILAKY